MSERSAGPQSDGFPSFALKRFWRVIDCKHRTPTYVDEGFPLVSTSEVKPGNLDLSLASRFVSQDDLADLTEGRQPRLGDLIYSRNASLGVAAHVATEKPFCMGQDVVLITSPRQDQRYLMYALNSDVARAQVASVCIGSTFSRINVSQIEALLIPHPPPEAQRTIARYLDRRTAALDALIEKKTRLIDRLREKRQALITEVVTRGLDPSAPMKDSGIAWIGPMPAGWRGCRAKYMLKLVSRPVAESDRVVTAFRDGEVTLRENRRTEGFTIAVKETGYQQVRRGDLVVHSMDAFAGAIGISDSEGKCTPEYLVCVAAASKVHLPYYSLVLREMARQHYIEIVCEAVRERAPRLRFSTLAELELPLPPYDEQVAITAYVERRAGPHATAIKKLTTQIARLREYRQALITEAVTGKIPLARMTAA